MRCLSPFGFGVVLSVAMVIAPAALASRHGRHRKRNVAELGKASAGKDVFAQNCVLCHGTDGKGDGPAAAALNPKPMNFHDRGRMSKLTDATLVKAVSDGGAAVGVSSVMPAFKGTLTEQQIRDVLAYIRTLSN